MTSMSGRARASEPAVCIAPIRECGSVHSPVRFTLADEEEKKHHAEVAEENKPLIERMQKALEGKVKERRVTTRLVDSPACVVVDENELSPHLQRLLRSAGQEAPEVKPILEINPEHELISRVKEASDDVFGEWSQLLLDQAMLAEGASLSDPASFVKRMNKLLLG